MAKTYMGSDAKLIERGSVGIFRANLCAVITTQKINKFNRAYDKFMSKLCKDFFCANNKAILKSTELREYFDVHEEQFRNALVKFVQFISSLDYVTVNIIYSVLDLNKLHTVKFYGTKRVPNVNKKPEDFIKHLGGYFSYIGPWKVCKECKLFNHDIFIDDFSGYETNAWNELKAHNKIRGLPNGDKCHRLISSSDIICRFIDDLLAQRKNKFDGRGIRKLIKDFELHNFKDFYVGHKDIKEIVPLNKKNVFLSHVYNKPMIFVLKEGNMPKEKEFIYSSDVFIEKLSNFAAKNHTGFKVIDYNYDHKLIGHGDILVYYGPVGRSQAETLKKMGYKITYKDLDKL